MINYLFSIGKKSKEACLKKIDIKTKNKVLIRYANLIKKNKNKILKENLKDLSFAKKKNLKQNLIDRLELDQKKYNGIIKSINIITKLKDPINRILLKWKRPNGLIIKRVTIPLGVLAAIYESRPNVTSDISCLCFKSGNSVILKGGSEAFYTNKILANLFRKSLKENKVNPNFVQLINTKNRKVVDILLSRMSKFIDMVIPRGGKNLVKKVQKLSKVPIIGHLEGICHTYVDKFANLKMAINIIHNAKLRNTSICGATETILINEKVLKKFTNPILHKLQKYGCKVIADKKVKSIFKGKSKLSTEIDWKTEYLSAKVSVKSVKDLNDAINHINKYGTMHTDAIITNNKKNAKIFLKNVKSSIAMHNTSTQFADGGEFGFGAEIGISTNNLPPRGPVGLNELVTYKYEVLGKGQIRK
tara:strand:+ start:1538 stop:2788 length:1251 start_codon:yes stop_codon:yes gene_type:complete